VTRQIKAMVSLVAVFALTGCKEDAQTRSAEFQKYLKAHQISERGDYLLVRYTFGVPDPVALSFGYVDNYAFCEEIREMYTARYGGETFACERTTMR